MSCNCSERSKSLYFVDGAAISPGTVIPQASLDPDNLGNVYGSLSVINDTDQDIKFTYMTTEGYAGEFIIPQSIKGFTKNLKNGVKYDLSTFKVISLDVATAAIGNISLNLGV